MEDRWVNSGFRRRRYFELGEVGGLIGREIATGDLIRRGGLVGSWCRSETRDVITSIVVVVGVGWDFPRRRGGLALREFWRRLMVIVLGLLGSIIVVVWVIVVVGSFSWANSFCISTLISTISISVTISMPIPCISTATISIWIPITITIIISITPPIVIILGLALHCLLSIIVPLTFTLPLSLISHCYLHLPSINRELMTHTIQRLQRELIPLAHLYRILINLPKARSYWLKALPHILRNKLSLLNNTLITVYAISKFFAPNISSIISLNWVIQFSPVGLAE